MYTCLKASKSRVSLVSRILGDATPCPGCREAISKCHRPGSLEFFPLRATGSMK